MREVFRGLVSPTPFMEDCVKLGFNYLTFCFLNNRIFVANMTRKIAEQITHIGGISQDVKRLKIWDVYPTFLGFSRPITFLLL